MYIFQYPVFHLGRSQPPLCHQPRLCRASGDWGTYTEGRVLAPRSTHCRGTNLLAGPHLCGQSGVDLSAGPAHREPRATHRFSKKKNNNLSQHIDTIAANWVNQKYNVYFIYHVDTKKCIKWGTKSFNLVKLKILNHKNSPCRGQQSPRWRYQSGQSQNSYCG